MKSVAKSFIDAVVSNREEHELKRFHGDPNILCFPPAPSYLSTRRLRLVQWLAASPSSTTPRHAQRGGQFWIVETDYSRFRWLFGLDYGYERTFRPSRCALWYSGELFSQPRCCDLKLWSRVKKPFPSFSFTGLNYVIRLRLCDPAHIDPRPMSHFRAQIG